MRSFVFTDAALGRQAGRFVWLAMDTEKAANASFRTKYLAEALPTYFIVDPATETPALRWVGGATVAQLQKVLDDGANAVANRGKGLDVELARADRFYATGKNKEAVQGYRDVLAKAPKGWPGYGRATESLLFALQRVDDDAACAATAREAFPRLAKTSSAANVAATGLGCALDLKADAPGREELVAEMVGFCQRVLADRTTKIAADDRSSVYDTLLEERTQAKDEAGRKKVAADWAAFLEGEAAKAKSPDGRAVFDSHRLGAYLAMGAPERAAAMLEASERDLPDDYNPPARLASAYKAMGRLDDALLASDRALAKVYGPRRLLVLRNRADILVAKGDPAAAKATLREALASARAMPEGQRSEGTIAALVKKLESIP